MTTLVKVSLFTLATLAAFPILAQSTSASAEARCRDCTFPFKIDKNRWRMPDNNMVIQIDESALSDGSILMIVTLRSPDSTVIVASGSIRRDRGQREVALTLYDSNGSPVNGEIIWVNKKESVIQARFTCRSNARAECLLPR